MKRFSLLFLLVAAPTIASDDRPIPHGEFATVDGKGIVRAYYGCATTRYRHAVLGDAIEGGCLVTEDHTGREHRITLSEQFVFEDVTPRLADIDGDASSDVVTIRSDVDAGAALVVYGLDNGTLIEKAATPPIGIAYRWLAPAGIADFDGDGTTDVAYVETPHLGGLLRIWSIRDGRLTELASLRGFSNHSIGASRVSLSRVIDHNEDGIADLALPDVAGRSIQIVSMQPELAVIDTLPWDRTYFDR